MDPNLDVEQNVKILAIAQDFYRYADNNLKIKNKAGQLVKFEPNKAQRALIDRVIQCLVEGKPIRIIILKARQMGLSTAVEAIIYWWTTTHKYITAMIVGHDDDSSKNIYGMFKRYYDNCNPLFQPTRKYNTKQDLVFDVSDDVKDKYSRLGQTPPGLSSIIKTGSAQKVSTGRSDTIQLLHGSEVGEWPKGEELVAALLQTVPLLPNTMIFLESTAKGMGNYFHKEWENAKKGDSVFEPFFFPWWMHDEYQIAGEIADYTEEELMIKDLILEAGYSETEAEAKLNFRRYKQREFKSDPRLLYQEYPSTDYEAFLASGRPRFDIQSLVALAKEAEKHESICYELTESISKEITAEPVGTGPFRVWDLPERGAEYVIGGDVAEGLKDGDYSVADVIDKKTLKTVARWRGHCDPDVFGEIIDRIGRFYNYALVGVEINNHGLTTVQRLRDLFYTNLYRRERGIDERFEEATAKLGWKTDMKTKRVAIDYLAEAIRERIIIDYDPVFAREAMTYVRDDNGRTNAEAGTFDDTVMAKAIALQMFEWSNTNKADLQVFIPDKMATRKSAHKVIR